MNNNDSLPDAMVAREAEEARKLAAHDDLVEACHTALRYLDTRTAGAITVVIKAALAKAGAA